MYVGVPHTGKTIFVRMSAEVSAYKKKCDEVAAHATKAVAFRVPLKTALRRKMILRDRAAIGGITRITLSKRHRADSGCSPEMLHDLQAVAGQTPACEQYVSSAESSGRSMRLAGDERVDPMAMTRGLLTLTVERVELTQASPRIRGPTLSSLNRPHVVRCKPNRQRHQRRIADLE